MENDYISQRELMVSNQIEARGVKDGRVLEAMRKVPRHCFVPDNLLSFAYSDEPLPIGEGQTISQPYIVAYMTEVLALGGDEKVLEIGTGSGYQTAVLAELAREIFTVEIVATLSFHAQVALEKQGYRNIRFRVGDGSSGWEEFAPYDAIMVTAAASSIPPKLKDQLGPLGRMTIPVGSGFQELVLLKRKGKGFKEKKLLPVRFVPLVTSH